ncbi:hypothetical protein NCLIV_026620 [Neospora caninum Liverpool]|uniref:Uncharacterized protein n=1 Tax=Neospora caninum (strain Liverpool) TaxID=572307 RepID=F0VGM9_NEOCL|nr:hypothetical protein NCLIV_026620 [Neospora caninum Liverpool]CBZ52873.1 hypothetical protein NCLIV_026620 [Neospora caninum Liverpool]|eukprot:XP_003882905.1 hypothetical protein NCLIV_026620 [Neospora caninum Liverpool]
MPFSRICLQTADSMVVGALYRRIWRRYASVRRYTCHSDVSPRGRCGSTVQLLAQAADSPTAPLLALVDHNAVEPSEAALQENVVAMIDHHDVLPEARRSTVSAFAVDIPGPAVGSCCTLVSQLWQELSRITANLVEPPVALSCLLLGAVAVDTTACDTALFGIRWSSPDKEMQAALWGRAETFLGRNFSSPEAIVRAFGRIKFDIPRQLSLGLPALMRADYKSFVYSDVCGEDLKVGFGALTVPLSVILHVPGCRLRQREEAAGSTNLRGAFASAAATLIEEQNLGVVVGLSTYPRPADDGGGDVLERQMALIGKKALQYLIEGAIAYVTREVPSGVMVLKTVQDQQPTGCASSVLETLTDVFFVSQIPVKYSRKVLEPRFRQYFASLSRTHAP